MTNKKVTVTLIKPCLYAGKEHKVGDKITVTEAQKKIMQLHGLIK